MMPLRPFRRWSLTAQLVTSYLVILGAGGLVTSLVGSYIVSSTMLEQERRTARHDLAAARSIYERHMDALLHAVRFAAADSGLSRELAFQHSPGLIAYLDAIGQTGPFDFVGIADRSGHVVATSSNPALAVADGVSMAALAPVRNALRGGASVATEIIPFELLAAHDSALFRRASILARPTERARRTSAGRLAGGMVQLAVAPILDDQGLTAAVLYAGVVLGGDARIVDRVDAMMYRGERYRGHPIGSVTVFQGDLRIATTVRREDGARAIGTRASAEVAEQVLDRGQVWNDRAFVVNDWYVSAYEPIRDSRSNIIGMLYVGIRHDLFTATRDRVILSFFAIASLGFVVIIFTTYFMIRSVTDPLVEIGAMARRITSGRFDQGVRTDMPGELGFLAESFNTMQASLREMHADLEEWGRTLEEKVEQRTAELVSMRARVAQSEHLASLGMLAAGVAHEINNPLGGILALTSLTLEDIPERDLRRENLEEVVRQTERCRDIVKGLLEFSRQSESHRERVDVNEILEKTLNLIENQALFFNVDVVRDWQGDLPPIAGDRSELQQVFMNLIVNAVQAMDEAGTVRIRTRADDATGEVEVQVTDDGHGIPGELIDRIFDPFFTTKVSGQGTGLGLSIVYGIVTKHEGTIAVASQPGRGTTFTVRFPILAGELAQV